MLLRIDDVVSGTFCPSLKGLCFWFIPSAFFLFGGGGAARVEADRSSSSFGGPIITHFLRRGTPSTIGMAKKKEKKNGPQEVEKQTDQAETFGDARDG